MGITPSKIQKFWRELKRRKVVKVMVLYATTSFILLEAASIVIDPLKLPEWIMTMLIVVLLIGFPIALIFSWIFDITPDGIEVTVGQHEKIVLEENPVATKRNLATNIIIGTLILLVGVLAYPMIFSGKGKQPISGLDKSIAVLPFTNDSPDSSNVYIINGLMESILNNLAKIEDLRVISRTSVEKYRNNARSPNPKLMPEIGADLDVNYIVEGSGQKYGDEIFLTVQLLEASSDRHLWSKQYKKKTDDIINLQIEIAKNIATEIQVLITPDEEERIKKAPTENVAAYDSYLKGVELLYDYPGTRDQRRKNLEDAIGYFGKAIELDENFALAYAKLTSCYYSLEKYVPGADYITQINWNADQALLADPQLSESLIAKGYYYMHEEEADFAIPYFEKSLEYNPNSSEAIGQLRGIYFWVRADTEKYLEYALRAVRLDVANKDSIEISQDFERLAMALRYSGFFAEAEDYLIKAHDYGFKSAMEWAELVSDNGENFQEALDLLLAPGTDWLGEGWRSRFIAQTYFFLRDYPNAEKYYREIIKIKNSIGSYEFKEDYGRMAFVFFKTGQNEDAEYYLNEFELVASNIQSILKHQNLAEYHAIKGNYPEVLENMKAFALEENYPYWIIRFFKYNPVYDDIGNTPEFQNALEEIESKFWTNHKRLRKSLEDDGFL